MPTSPTRPRHSPNVFSSVSGSIFGFFLYPLKSLLLDIPSAALLTVPTYFVCAIVGTVAVRNLTRPISNRLLRGTLIFLGGALSFLVFAPIATALIIPGLIIRNLFTQPFKGLREGRKYGIFTVLKNIATKWKKFSCFFSLNLNNGLEAMDINNLEDVDIDNLEDVERSPLEVPDLSEKSTIHSFEKLSTEELRTAERLSEKSASKDELKNKIDLYKNLLERLTNLDKAIETRRQTHGELSPDQLQTAFDKDNEDLALTQFNDELIALMPIFNPVLLVKKMEVDGEWQVVPGNTHITDGFSMSKWFQSSSKHPFNGDSLIKPTPVKGHRALYSWHQYTGISQELKELASSIRTAISEAEVVEDNHDEVNARIQSTVSAISTRFFGSRKTASTAPDPEKANSEASSTMSDNVDAQDEVFADDDDDGFSVSSKIIPRQIPHPERANSEVALTMAIGDNVDAQDGAPTVSLDAQDEVFADDDDDGFSVSSKIISQQVLHPERANSEASLTMAIGDNVDAQDGAPTVSLDAQGEVFADDDDDDILYHRSNLPGCSS